MKANVVFNLIQLEVTHGVILTLKFNSHTKDIRKFYCPKHQTIQTRILKVSKIVVTTLSTTLINDAQN